MKKLEDMIGEQIAACVPMFDPIVMQKMTLHAVEQAGIWVGTLGALPTTEYW